MVPLARDEHAGARHVLLACMPIESSVDQRQAGTVPSNASRICRYQLPTCARALTFSSGNPVAEPIVGEFPAGRWACFHPYDYEGIKRNNGATVPYRCSPWVYGVIELMPDGTGHWLSMARNAVDGSFRIEGSEMFYARYARHEIRWQLDEPEFWIQSAYNYRYHFLSVTDEVFILNGNNNNFVIIEIGSPSCEALFELIKCVTENRKRKIFQLVTCPKPPFDFPVTR